MTSWICTFCGHAAARRFPGDQCPACGQTLWQCGRCSRVVIAAARPQRCDACGSIGGHRNRTPYIPDWRGPGADARCRCARRQAEAGIVF